MSNPAFCGVSFGAGKTDATGIDAINDEDFSRDADLFDIGVVSFQLVDCVSNLRDSFPELTLPATLVFDYPLAAAICDFIENDMSRLGLSTS